MFCANVLLIVIKPDKADLISCAPKAHAKFNLRQAGWLTPMSTTKKQIGLHCAKHSRKFRVKVRNVWGSGTTIVEYSKQTDSEAQRLAKQ